MRNFLAAKIRRFGYSHRIPFANFIQRYSILVYPITMELPLTHETCETILQKLKMQNWISGKIDSLRKFFVQVSLQGKSKIFLKYYHAEQLTRLYSNFIHAIITIQSYMRMYLARLRLKYRQYKYSNDLIIEELHRHMKFVRVNENKFPEFSPLFFFSSQD